MKLYLIAGTSGSGKDNLSVFLKERIEAKGKRVCLLKITKPLYELCRDHFGWDGNMDNKPRDLLQNLGVEIIQNKLHRKDFLINRLIEDIKILELYFDVGIVSDIRFSEELDVLCSKFSATTILLSRDNYTSTLTDKQKNHITEKDFLNYKNYNYKLINTDLDKLKRDALIVLEGNDDE